MSDPTQFRFGAFDLDPKSGELRKDGDPVKLPPQPFKTGGERGAGQKARELDIFVAVQQTLTQSKRLIIAMPWGRLLVHSRRTNRLDARSGLSRPAFPTIFAA